MEAQQRREEMSTGTGLFLLGVWIAFAAAIASPALSPIGYVNIKKLTIIITVLTVICILLANLYRL